MTNYHAHGWVDDSLTAPGNQSWQNLRVNKRGEVRVIDFVSEMLQQDRCYQVRLGSLATGVAVDSTLTDQAAEICYNAASGLTIIPIQLGVAAREIATATTFQCALKGVAGAGTGTAFVPIPLLQGGTAASGTACAANNGGVAVPAEAVTTTTRIFEYELVNTHTPTTFKAGLDTLMIAAAVTQLHYIGVGAAVIYLQIAATTAFPLTFSNLNVVELTSESLS